MSRILDVGCGKNKKRGACGLDIHPYEGVDLVHDINSVPWPIDDNSFDTIICHHIIEHVIDPVAFMKEIHRIGADGATVEFITPHYSCVWSWGDPTHRWHLSSRWYRLFIESGYLSAQTGVFELVSNKVTFGSRRVIRSYIPRLMVLLLGLDYWERQYAFVYPAENILTTLRVKK